MTITSITIVRLFWLGCGLLLLGVLASKELHRWWVRGCAACLIEADMDDTASSRSWAFAANRHTCFFKRKRVRALNGSTT